jgi:lactoylglutathione lyase
MTTATMPNVFTRDIDAALAFYRDLLGLAVAFRFPLQGRSEHVVLRLGESQLALTRGGPADVGLEPSAGNSFELVVWCDDVDREAARLRDAGAPILVAPYDHPARHRRAYVGDPDGNWIALVDAH